MTYANLDKRRATHRAYEKRTKDKQREWHRRSVLKNRYGITYDQYLEIEKSQLGLCAICGEGPVENAGKMSRLHVDHDHETGKVRGLLCGLCNVGIGNMRDSIAILELAQNYLSRSRM